MFLNEKSYSEYSKMKKDLIQDILTYSAGIGALLVGIHSYYFYQPTFFAGMFGGVGVMIIFYEIAGGKRK